MTPYTAARIRPQVFTCAERRRPKSRAWALVLIGLLLMGSMTIVVAGSFMGSSALAASPRSASPSPTDVLNRDPLLWPFARDSIWNLPIGAGAVYVPAGIHQATDYGMTTDVDVLILTPTAPETPVYYNGDAWDVVPGRCDVQGGVEFHAPIPENFVVPGNGNGIPGHGTTPNYATAILDTDGITLIQGQPFARCTAGGNATMWWFQKNERLDGLGNSGAHGGSMLSSIGGTIRLGELVPGGMIRHAMKLNLDGVNYYSGLGGFRWPATAKDSCAPGCYTGSVPAMRMGSLLALRPDFDFSTLETEPARILAHAFQDYGAYAADNAGWSVYGIDTEYSPSGDVMVEFQDRWGFSIMPEDRDVPWARDMDRIFLHLNVVDNWNYATWLAASVSNGALGSGLGVPRVAWAPDFGDAIPDRTAPVSTATLNGAHGSGNWFLSPVDVTVAATDSRSGVASIHVRTDGGPWTTYTSPVSLSDEGSHTIDYYATDVAGNAESPRTVNVKIDSVAPVSAAQVDGTTRGDGYLSPVQVTLTASDGTSGVQSILYRIDGGAMWTYTSPFLMGGGGTHLLEYFAKDVAGNVETTKILPIQIAGAGRYSPPVAILTAVGTAGANGWYVSNVDVSLDASSPSGASTVVSYHMDDGPWATYTNPFTVPEGRHVLEYQALDTDGYLGPLRSEGINVDSTAPVITRTSGAGDAIPPGRPFAWVGSDALSGVARYEVSVDGGPFESVGKETSLAHTWAIGSHVAIVRAWDVAGNERTKSIPFRVGDGGFTSGSGVVLTDPLLARQPDAFVSAIGSIMAFVGFLFLNRPMMERLERLRSRWKAR